MFNFAPAKYLRMQLQAVDTVDTISPEDFKKNYYGPMKPLVIKNLSKDWWPIRNGAGIILLIWQEIMKLGCTTT